MVRRPFVAVCLLVLAGLLGGASPAAADNCTHDLVDGRGFAWGLMDNGHVIGPGNAGFDDLAALAVDLDEDNSFSSYVGTPDGCLAPEEGGREIVFPTESLEEQAPGEGLEVSRKVYVPASGSGFIRWLDVIHNTTGAFRTLNVEYRGNAETSSFVRVTGTSSGDRLMTPADAWIAWEDTRGTFTDTAFLMDATAPSTLTRYNYFPGSQYLRDGESDSLYVRYAGIRLVPDATVTLMHFAVQGNTPSETNQFAMVHGGGSPELYTGLSAAERSQLLNWPANPPSTDADSDGVANVFDNCPANANAGQADLDGDGVGDPCDPDEDGDGVSNAVEAAVGGDPRKLDTDGDGKRDGADTCPTLASSEADGCPDRVAPRFALPGLPKLVKRSRFMRRGLSVTVDRDERSSVVVELIARLRGARIARAGDIVLANRRLQMSDATRTVRLKPARRLRSRFSRRMRLLLRVTALDATGNTRTARRRITVR